MIGLKIHINDLDNSKVVTIYNRIFIDKLQAQLAANIIIKTMRTLLDNNVIISFTISKTK